MAEGFKPPTSARAAAAGVNWAKAKMNAIKRLKKGD